MNENDLFSKMSKKEKKDLLKFLKEYYIEYKPYLKLGDLSFGLEMEFLGSDDMDDYSNYTPFSLACEDSVDRVNGYELQSRILYDNEFSYRFTGESDNWYAMRLEKQEINYFGGVQIIEYKNNRERQGDFEQLIPLIDAYNVLQSDRVNDKEQFVDAFLFLSGIDLDSEQAKKLREERILMGYEGADARYLDKIMRENDIEILKNSLKEDIHRFSQVPDLSDEAFAGNLSGVAIKYKLMGFEQSTKNKERYFAKSLKKRLELYINFLSLTKSMEKIPVHKIDIAFTRNLPVNELEVSQMIQNLTGVVTNETLLTQLSFVSDPKEENEKLSKEREEKSVSRIREVEEMAAGGMWQ